MWKCPDLSGGVSAKKLTKHQARVAAPTRLPSLDAHPGGIVAMCSGSFSGRASCPDTGPCRPALIEAPPIAVGVGIAGAFVLAIGAGVELRAIAWLRDHLLRHRGHGDHE